MIFGGTFRAPRALFGPSPNDSSSSGAPFGSIQDNPSRRSSSHGLRQRRAPTRRYPPPASARNSCQPARLAVSAMNRGREIVSGDIASASREIDRLCKQEVESSPRDRPLFRIAPCGKRKSGQRRKRPGSCFLHDGSTMVFNGPLADPEISCNIFARVTGQNHLHDLALPSSEAGEVISRILAPFHELPGITR